MNENIEKNIEKLKNFPIKDGEITGVEWQDGVKQPDPNPLGVRLVDKGGFYRVTMKLYPSDQSNITVVVYLPRPKDWNGRFLGTGNGGSAGAIAEGALCNGVGRGYATANTDMGTSLEPDDGIGQPEVWKDFGYRATHLMTVEGKALTAYFYGRKPEYSYFLGGSTGGQQAFSEAQRYPEDYDGIACLSPAFDRIRLHSFFIWNWQQIHRRADAAFTPQQAQQWRDAIVRVYGKTCKSNEEDAFLAYPGAIRENPMDHPDLQQDIQKLLTEGQREALRDLYDGPRNPATGERVIAAFLPGTEAEGLSLADISNREAFAHDFFYLFRWIWGKDFDFMKFDFQKDLAEAIKRLGPVLDAIGDRRKLRRHHSLYGLSGLLPQSGEASGRSRGNASILPVPADAGIWPHGGRKWRSGGGSRGEHGGPTGRGA